LTQTAGAGPTAQQRHPSQSKLLRALKSVDESHSGVPVVEHQNYRTSVLGSNPADW
jgi:hypothetical protein